MGEQLSFSGEDITETGLDKLWVLNGDEGEASDGMVEAAERLLADLPELGEIAARNRIAEVLPGYRPASTSDRTEPGTVDMTPTGAQVRDFGDG